MNASNDSLVCHWLRIGAVVLPALISITEMKSGMSGKEFLTAAVAGYEIGPRVGLCMGPEHIAQGWHSGATLGVFSAAAGAARGLKLDVARYTRSASRAHRLRDSWPRSTARW